MQAEVSATKSFDRNFVDWCLEATVQAVIFIDGKARNEGRSARTMLLWNKVTGTLETQFAQIIELPDRVHLEFTSRGDLNALINAISYPEIKNEKHS